MNDIYENTHLKRINKIFSYLVVIMMLGNVYLFPLFKSLDMGEVLVLLFIPYFLINLKLFTIRKRFTLIYIFIFYSFIISLLMCFKLNGNMSDPMIRIIRDFFYYFIILFLGYHFFDMVTFKKAIIVFCVLLSGFVIMQVLVYTLTGYLLPGFILNASINDGGYNGAQLYANYINYANIAGYLKPNGFLCEPAHCAQCFFVSLILLLNGHKVENRDIKIALFISLGMILTMSTSAILYLIVSWSVWFFREGKRNIIKIILLSILLIFIVIFALKKGELDNFLIVLQRFTNTISGKAITNSSQLRMIKGFTVFLALPLTLQIFGIGFGNYANAISLLNNYGINMLNNEYMNTVSYILVSSGIIGFLLISFFLIIIFFNNNELGRITIVALIIMSFGSSIYSSPICIWLMLIILYSCKKGVVKEW